MLFTLKYLPQTFPASIQILALHLPKACTCRQATIKNQHLLRCQLVSLQKWKANPFWKETEEDSGMSSPEDWFWGFLLHISLIYLEVLPNTAVLQHQSWRKLLCSASVWLLHQSTAQQNIKSLVLIKHKCRQDRSHYLRLYLWNTAVSPWKKCMTRKRIMKGRSRDRCYHILVL